MAHVPTTGKERITIKIESEIAKMADRVGRCDPATIDTIRKVDAVISLGERNQFISHDETDKYERQAEELINRFKKNCVIKRE